jgi:hypothetical protein
MQTQNSALSFANVAATLPATTRTKTGFIARCPCHSPDRNPSLAVDSSADGKALLVCRAGCAQDVVIARVKELIAADPNLAPASRPSVDIRRKPENPSFDPLIVELDIPRYVSALSDSDSSDPFSESAGMAFLSERGISARVATEMRFGYDASTSSIAIPSFWEGQCVGLKFRRFAGVTPTNKWRQLPGSATDVLLLADTPLVDSRRIAFVVESPLDGALVRSEGFNALALHSAVVPKTERFLECVKVAQGKFDKFVLVGDSDVPGIRAVAQMEQLLGSDSCVRRPVPQGKDVGDYFRADPTAFREWLKHQVDGAYSPSRGYTLIAPSLDTIEEEPTGWLWPEFIPEKLTILAGAPGTGKSTLAYTFAAIVSSGSMWPDSTRASTGRVLIWSSEDTAADIIVPRLKAAGACLGMVHTIESVDCGGGVCRPFDPASDLPEVRKFVLHHKDVKLLVIDPIVSVVTGDMHKANDVRRALQGIVDFAGEFGIAVLGISHFAKGTSGRDTLERVIGSQAFGAAPRMVLATAKDKDTGGCVLVRSKSNIAPDTGGFRYSLDVVEHLSAKRQTIQTVRIAWGDHVEGTSRQILSDIENGGDNVATQTDRAKEFLLTQFAQANEQRPDDLLQKAKTLAGIGAKSVRQAAKELDVKMTRKGFPGVSVWVYSPTLGN